MVSCSDDNTVAVIAENEVTVKDIYVSGNERINNFLFCC